VINAKKQGTVKK